jgi:hypothetical protein
MRWTGFEEGAVASFCICGMLRCIRAAWGCCADGVSEDGG